MRYLKYLFAAPLIALAVASCTTTETSPSSMTPDSSAYVAAQLEGTWILSSIQPAGAGRIDRPSTATYTLTFASNNRLSTRADCNTCAGNFAVDGSTITAGPNLACTRAACPTATFENSYTSLLGGQSQAVVTNSSLTLSSSRGSLWLARQD